MRSRPERTSRVENRTIIGATDRPVVAEGVYPRPLAELVLELRQTIWQRTGGSDQRLVVGVVHGGHPAAAEARVVVRRSVSERPEPASALIAAMICVVVRTLPSFRPPE